MKITIHKETLYILSLILLALAVALSVISNLGASAYVVPSLSLSYKIGHSLPATFNPVLADIISSQAFSEMLIHMAMLIIFCVVIRKFRPFFLLSFVTTIIYSSILYGVQWIPAFWPEVNHNYPLYLRIIMLALSMVLTATSVACGLKSYLYPPTNTFIQKGLIEHFKIKKEWIIFLSFDMAFMLMSVFIIYCIYHDWHFWNYNLSYGTLLAVILCGPLIGVIVRFLNKILDTPTLLPKWEKAFEIEQTKGY